MGVGRSVLLARACLWVLSSACEPPEPTKPTKPSERERFAELCAEAEQLWGEWLEGGECLERVDPEDSDPRYNSEPPYVYESPNGRRLTRDPEQVRLECERVVAAIDSGRYAIEDRDFEACRRLLHARLNRCKEPLLQDCELVTSAAKIGDECSKDEVPGVEPCQEGVCYRDETCEYLEEGDDCELSPNACAPGLRCFTTYDWYECCEPIPCLNAEPEDDCRTQWPWPHDTYGDGVDAFCDSEEDCADGLVCLREQPDLLDPYIVSCQQDTHSPCYGDRCQLNPQTACGADDCTCVAGLCRAPLRNGETCRNEDECAEELTCFGPEDAMTCQPPRSEGESCRYSHHCESPLICFGWGSDSDGSCVPPRADGESCVFDMDCENPTAVDGNRYYGACVGPRGEKVCGGVRAGGRCEAEPDGIQCVPGTVCVGERDGRHCRPLGQAGDACTKEVRAPYDPSVFRYCADGLRCEEDVCQAAGAVDDGTSKGLRMSPRVGDRSWRGAAW